MRTRKIWTKEETIILKENYYNLNYKKLSELLNRSKASILNRIKKLNLKKNSYNYWKNEEVEYLKENYDKINIEDLCKELNKSKGAIILKEKRTNLDISKNIINEKPRLSIKGIPKSIEHRKKLSNATKKYSRFISEKMRLNNPMFNLETRGKMKINKRKPNPKLSITRKRLYAEGKIKQLMPKKDTSIEIKIQNFLKELNLEYFTHQYMKIEHGYQCDILIPSMNLVIEADGNFWHHYPTRTDLDNIRTKEMLEKGFKVLRLWEVEIKEMDINEFKELIYNIK